jgi:hypothetical protein
MIAMSFDRLAVDLTAPYTIVLKRPDKANAIDHAMWQEIRAAMHWLGNAAARGLPAARQAFTADRSRPARCDPGADRRCLRRAGARSCAG